MSAQVISIPTRLCMLQRKLAVTEEIIQTLEEASALQMQQLEQSRALLAQQAALIEKLQEAAKVSDKLIASQKKLLATQEKSPAKLRGFTIQDLWPGILRAGR